MKLKRLFLAVALLTTTLLSAQSQQELITQARAMGATDAQINQALASQQPTSKAIGASLSSSNEGRGEDVQVSNIKVVAEDVDDNVRDVFGRDIFTNKSLTFSPNYNIPTPQDYTLGAGDEVKIDIWGNSEFSISQKISPDGRIFISNLGPISLSGLTVSQAEAKVKSELSNIFKGLSDGSNTLSFSLGQIRSIQVNIVGEAFAPGTYILPSFSTLFNALYMAGGVNDIGSLRSIKVYRNNKLEADIDVYDYLLNGKSDVNVRLEEADVIIVSPYESLVTTNGELKRNRRYELKEGETLAQLIEMAGSFKGGTYRESVMVRRKDGDYLTVNSVKADDFASFEMLDGDVLTVKGVADRYENRIDISGAVWYPGVYELKSDVSTVKELVEAAGGLKGSEFANRAYIIRRNPDFTESIISFDIKEVVGGSAADIALEPDDKLNIPTIFDLRESYTVMVKGAVNNGRTMSYRDNLTVEDVIVLAGGLTESASEIKVDIARRVKDPQSDSMPDSIVEVFEVNLNENLKIASSGEPLYLEPFDEVYVRRSPGYREQESVIVGGEVLFRGDYVLKSANSRLSDILADAGGVTSFAYTKGATLIRLANREDRQRARTVAEISRNSAITSDSVAMANIDIERYAVGIDLVAALENPGGFDDIVLQDGDIIYVPKAQSTVKVSGAVLYPNSTTYMKNMTAKECIEMAGGYSTTARKRPIVIYMNGKIAITKRVFFVKKYPEIEPGCEVLVANKKARERMSSAEIMSMATSTTSMAALVTSIISAL